MTYILWPSDFVLYLEDYLMYVHHTFTKYVKYDVQTSNVRTNERTNEQTNERTNIRTDEREDENYIPLGINAGGIISPQIRNSGKNKIMFIYGFHY